MNENTLRKLANNPHYRMTDEQLEELKRYDPQFKHIPRVDKTVVRVVKTKPRLEESDEPRTN